jgi:hypothetical protein
MNESLPITFKLMPAAMLLGIIIILLSIPLLYRANKYVVRELIAAGMVIIVLATGAMLVHLRLTMFTPIQAVALFIMVTAVPSIIAVLRSLLHLKKL